MALSETQFEALREQLKKKKESLGDEGYSLFLQKASEAKGESEEVDNDGFATDVVQGVAKSGGDFALGLGTIGRKIQNAIPFMGGNTGKSVFDKGSEQNTQAKEILKRDTAGEKVGGFIGDVASYAVPGSAATKVTKGLNFLTRAATLGAADATVTTIKQGEVNRNTVDSAIIAAAFPVVGAGINSAKKAVLPSGKEAGGKVINSLIKPLLKDFSYGKNPGKAVAEAGITANSLDDLALNIKKARQGVGSEAAELYKKSNKVFDVSESMSSLDDALVEASKSPRTNSAIITRLQNLKDDLLQVGEDGLPTRELKNLSADDVFNLKKEIGDLTRWTGNATDDEVVNKALKQTYGKLKGQLDEAIPGSQVLNDKYANLKSAEIATEYRDKIAARQNILSFSGTQLGTAAAVTSAIVSGGTVVPILAGAGVGVGTEALKSPAVKTRVAAWLASASKEEIKDAFVQAPWLRGALQSVLFGEE